ncbi:MurR/RpiR family transcriptional regulator [Pseudopelagicola sp. nBUS_19]|uniref:MurR/RpiR family transcriptional regulator n=1 Tax=Pseudopelagicola sp. nBUS_19 TaxID=3395316 RepID=UPI003EC0E854
MKHFKSLVESYDGKLTVADRALISIVLSEPSEAIYLSSGELAAKANVHASTVVRLARKLGFEGYPDMRSSVRRDVDQNPSFSNISQQRRTSIEQGSNLANLIEAEMAAIAAVASSVSQIQIDDGAKFLANANSIYLVGRGGAAPLMAHLDRRLRRASFRVETLLNLQRRDMAERLISLKANDVVIVFGFQAPVSLPAGFEALMDHARVTGAKTISIGDTSILTARPRADLTLSISRPDQSAMQMRSGAMLVCEALAMTLANKDPERAVKGLESLERLRSDMQSSEAE